MTKFNNYQIAFYVGFAVIVLIIIWNLHKKNIMFENLTMGNDNKYQVPKTISGRTERLNEINKNMLKKESYINSKIKELDENIKKYDEELENINYQNEQLTQNQTMKKINLINSNENMKQMLIEQKKNLEKINKFKQNKNRILRYQQKKMANLKNRLDKLNIDETTKKNLLGKMITMSDPEIEVLFNKLITADNTLVNLDNENLMDPDDISNSTYLNLLNENEILHQQLLNSNMNDIQVEDINIDDELKDLMIEETDIEEIENDSNYYSNGIDYLKPLPTGMWKDTCTNVKFVGNNLMADCEDNEGKLLTSAFDPSKCDKYSLINNNGKLMCEKDATKKKDC